MGPQHRHYAVTSLVALLGVAACNSGEEPAERPPRPVQWVEAQAWNGERGSVYVGRAEFAESPVLAFEVGGTILDMNRERGERFARGDILARLDSRTYDLDVEARDAAIAQARATLANAEIDYQRKAALRGTGAVAGSVIDAAQAARDGARQTVRELEAARGVALKRRGDTVLRAPFAGSVVSRLVEPGRTVSSGQGVFETSADDAPVQAVFLVSETDVMGLAVGDTHRLSLPTTGDTLEATVAEIGTTADASLAFPVAFDLPEDSGVRPGMTVRLSLSGPVEASGVLLPLPAVQTRPGRDFVARLDGETVRFVDVDVVSLRDDGAVVRGVDPGTRIVSRGTAQLRDGQTVVPLDPGTRRYGD